jgi:phosphoadenosine phosphosulfate reductase
LEVRSLVVQQVELPAQSELDRLNAELESRTPQEIIRWAVDRFGDGLTLACSFGGVSGMALLDMAVRIEPHIEVFYLDTGFLFPHTLKTRDEAIRRYGIRPVAYHSPLTAEEQAQRYGDRLWEREPDKCCGIRKVDPNRRALEGRSAWITGLRRDQANTRRTVNPVAWDHKFGLYKISPLAHWDEKDVWRYIFKHSVPYNPLHDEGYPSIGCTHCTRAVAVGEDPRAGRWSGTAKVECGLHR